MKMCAKRHHNPQVSKNAKIEVLYAFCKFKPTMSYKNEICSMILIKLVIRYKNNMFIEV